MVEVQQDCLLIFQNLVSWTKHALIILGVLKIKNGAPLEQGKMNSA
jgi:hypothetical protein